MTSARTMSQYTDTETRSAKKVWCPMTSRDRPRPVPSGKIHPPKNGAYSPKKCLLTAAFLGTGRGVPEEVDA